MMPNPLGYMAWAHHSAFAFPASPPPLQRPLCSSEVTLHLMKCHCLRQTRCDDSGTSVGTQMARQGTPPRVDRDKSLCVSCPETKTWAKDAEGETVHRGLGTWVRSPPHLHPIVQCDWAWCLLLEAWPGTDHGAGPAGARMKDARVQILALCPQPHGRKGCCF